MKKILLLLAFAIFIFACKKDEESEIAESTIFEEIGTIDIGSEGAAEISAFDKDSKKLFVVDNSPGNNKIAVVDLTNPATPIFSTNIDVAKYGGAVNSVAVKDGKLAAAIEAADKVSDGKVVVFNTITNAEISVINVGALPDMVCFSPDGKYILSANEGEPNPDYTIDPIGSVSIISVNENYAVRTINFSSFASKVSELKSKGMRIFGKNASFEADIEPEYIAVSENSTTAWVTLQENNAIAKIDLASKTISNIFPLGTKNYNESGNQIDPSNEDGGVNFANWPVRSYYLPDAIATLYNNGVQYIFTANEGDAREYPGLSPVEIRRVNHTSVILDPLVFPVTEAYKTNAKLGRLNITTTAGDTDADGDYDELYSYGGRSFSVWNANTGQIIFDSKDQLDKTAVENNSYDDSRSDDKGSEPEGITLGKVGGKQLLFVGLERADGIVIYDISNPSSPSKLQWLKVGDAPEGVLFVPAKESPTSKSLLIVSSEGDGVIKIFTTKDL